jgi:hypothetical protein
VLPPHGWIGCNRCYLSSGDSRLIGNGAPPSWKIENPNGAWGSSDPLVVVLGFSRGARQSKPRPFDQIAFAGMRNSLTKIMKALHLLRPNDHVDRRICATEKDFHFGSLFRCSVSMWDARKSAYAKSGNNILEKFLESDETRKVAHNCTEQHLSALAARTKLVLLLGNNKDYVSGCRVLFKRLYPDLRPLNDVSYATDKITWVHTIHAAAQGDYVPQWLEGAQTAIGRKFRPAFEGVLNSAVVPLLGGVS